jgi:hypothetical protein
MIESPVPTAVLLAPIDIPVDPQDRTPTIEP